jgi:hypothetical protein
MTRSSTMTRIRSVTRAVARSVRHISDAVPAMWSLRPERKLEVRGDRPVAKAHRTPAMMGTHVKMPPKIWIDEVYMIILHHNRTLFLVNSRQYM